jgi:hypothetical protein
MVGSESRPPISETKSGQKSRACVLRRDAVGVATKLGVWFVDVPPPPSARLRLKLVSQENHAEIADATVGII